MKLLKWILFSVTALVVTALLGGYYVLQASLPQLDGEVSSTSLSETATLSRDTLGSAVIKANSEHDAAYVLGFAHAQDRLFQMDLLRRQSAGELSQIIGSAALQLDKRLRFHQLRKHAQRTLAKLPQEQIDLLNAYTLGVNEGAESLSTKPFEYYLLGSSFKAWQKVDTLLVIYSMYLDLQGTQTDIDFAFTALKSLYGNAMYEFFTLPSNYQSALDYSTIRGASIEVPAMPRDNKDDTSTRQYDYENIQELADIGSNNWAVAGALTSNKKGALLSNDMHLGLSVPAIWYRAQINYPLGNDNVQVTGVSLPGTPAIIVGSNNHVSWGFTNSNVDNVDWIALSSESTTYQKKTYMVEETIDVANAEPETINIEMSVYGPVKTFNGKKYALKWVAHEDYAVNVKIGDMAKMKDLDSALELAKKVRIPAQNMVIGDVNGDIAWQLTGAMPNRSSIARHAISENQYNTAWKNAEYEPAHVIRPENGRVWTGNARVMGVEDLARFGDGGYALGARQQQIMALLMESDEFDERAFYDIQLDNRALFLMPWHQLLLSTLQNSPQKFANDIKALEQWQACACADSVGYTLVRRFRSTLINQLVKPIARTFRQHDLAVNNIMRGIEPAIWTIIQQEPSSWLPDEYENYTRFYIDAYEITKEKLLQRHGGTQDDLSLLAWGKVNSLKVTHPFSAQLGPFADYFNMQEVAAFGDSYMPAVQANKFGASQRFIVQSGNLENAILTVPGGQSGHVLSDFYRNGFTEYAAQESTPLLPSKTLHDLQFLPIKD